MQSGRKRPLGFGSENGTAVESKGKKLRSTRGVRPTLRFSGAGHFRQKICCSLLSGKAVIISDIRSDTSELGSGEEGPQIGILGHEASFLRLVDAMTNGTRTEINDTGTRLSFRPGFIVGGVISHDCGTKRCIGWFLEGILPLALFAKKPVKLTLTGITNDDLDWSLDTIRAVTLSLMREFGVGGEEEKLECKVSKRGSPPLGGGEVIISIPISRQLSPVDLVNVGLVKRVRGNAYCAKVSPQMANRMAEAAKGVLLRYLPDVWVHTDRYSGEVSGKSPGFGVSLVAETTTGMYLSAETVAMSGGTLPEDAGRKASKMLLEEIRECGCVDSSHQSLVLLLMVLGPEDISRVRLGKLTEYTIQYLRYLKDFFGVTFKIVPSTDDVSGASNILLSCRGIGYKNLARSAT